MTQAITRVYSVQGLGQVTIPYAAIEQPIEHDTVLIEFDGVPNENVDMQFEFATHIVFEGGVVGEPGNTYGVIRCLEEAYTDVEKGYQLF